MDIATIIALLLAIQAQLSALQAQQSVTITPVTETTTYTLKEGDLVSEIAGKFGISVSQFPKNLAVGDELSISGTTVTRTTESSQAQ